MDEGLGGNGSRFTFLVAIPQSNPHDIGTSPHRGRWTRAMEPKSLRTTSMGLFSFGAKETFLAVVTSEGPGRLRINGPGRAVAARPSYKPDLPGHSGSLARGARLCGQVASAWRTRCQQGRRQPSLTQTGSRTCVPEPVVSPGRFLAISDNDCHARAAQFPFSADNMCRPESCRPDDRIPGRTALPTADP